MFDRMRAVISKNATQLFDAASKKMQPEYTGVNALAGAFALLVMADRKVEKEELEEVSEFLLDMDIIMDKNLMREVSEFFVHHVDELKDGYREGVMEGKTVVGEILSDIQQVKSDGEWSDIIAQTITMVTSGDKVDRDEVRTRERILHALGRD